MFDLIAYARARRYRVRNLHDGRVEVFAEGTGPALEALVAQLEQGPSGARVIHVETEWTKATGSFDDFRVIF